MIRLTLILMFATSVSFAGARKKEMAKDMVVIVPVADIRSKPERRTKAYEYDELQETQVEKGEPIEVQEVQGDWARVECPWQMEFTHNNTWQGYPGWIETKYLGVDPTQRKMEMPQVFDDVLRKNILDQALLHVGQVYLWGGRSLHDPVNMKTVTGVDCSGLVNWSYRRVGWQVPRDAHEQFMKARRIEPNQMKPADLIFLAKADKPEKIVHVALYKDYQTLLEAPFTGERVREISFEKRFGMKLTDLKNGQQVGDRIIYFGTFFPEVP